MLIIRCCKCRAWICAKDDFKDGIRESHTYCDFCLREEIKESILFTNKKGCKENG